MMHLCKRLLVTAFISVALTGCTNGKFTYGKALGDLSKISGVTTGLEASDPPTDDPAAVDAPEGPPLIVGFEAIRVALPLASVSGANKVYDSPDGVTLAMTAGFVTRATGLGIDANGMYLAANSPWFDGMKKAADANASSDRVAEYWSKRRVLRDKYRCTLSSAPRDGGGSIIDETCKRYFEPVTFVNRYWVTADDKIECSRQWIHPQLAPLQFFATTQQAVDLDLTKNGC